MDPLEELEFTPLIKMLPWAELAVSARGEVFPLLRPIGRAVEPIEASAPLAVFRLIEGLTIVATPGADCVIEALLLPAPLIDKLTEGAVPVVEAIVAPAFILMLPFALSTKPVVEPAPAEEAALKLTGLFDVIVTLPPACAWRVTGNVASAPPCAPTVMAPAAAFKISACKLSEGQYIVAAED